MHDRVSRRGSRISYADETKAALAIVRHPHLPHPRLWGSIPASKSRGCDRGGAATASGGKRPPSLHST